MVNGEESDPYEEPQERNVRVFYKLKMKDDPASKGICPMKRILMMTITSP